MYLTVSKSSLSIKLLTILLLQKKANLKSKLLLTVVMCWMFNEQYVMHKTQDNTTQTFQNKMTSCVQTDLSTNNVHGYVTDTYYHRD